VLSGALYSTSTTLAQNGVIIMIRITANVVLWKKSELQRPENLRILLLVIATVVLAFLVSPIVGALIVGLMLWQNSRGSLAIHAARRAAEMNLQIGSSVAENPD
jgi:uncharacterized protein (DUF983 family)